MNNPLMQDYTTALRGRREIETRLGHLRDDLKARELHLTPTGEQYKNLGANDSDRKNVLEKLFLSDAVCQEMRVQIRDIELRQAAAEGAIAGFEAERRSNEWLVTKQLTQVLERRYSFSNIGPDAAVTETLALAKEEAVTDILFTNWDPEDVAYWDLFEDQEVPEPEPVPIENKIPF